MIRNKKTLRAIALFFLIDIISSIFLPSVSLANSGSPSMPEYTSFVSASSSEMVDLQTGDFKYNVPLLDVPSPEGSYPVNLFYQSGIKLEQDASWVGLGWNINAGAITRNVDVFADDYSGVNYSITQVGTTSDKLDEPLGINEINPSSDPYKNTSFTPTTGTSTVYGSIQTYNSTNGTSTPTVTRTLDSYAMNNPANGDYFTNHNPESDLGGSMPAYDQYIVSGQGLGSLQGEIQPVNLENGSLFRLQATSGSTVIKDFNIDKVYTQPKLQFRYLNEFSNSYKATPNDYVVTPTSTSLSFSPNGLGYTYTLPDANGLNTSNMRLAGARHIEYYTNTEISGTGGTSGTSTALKNGFIKYQGLADAARNNLAYTNAQNTVNYNYDVSKQIGGFSITDETGNTYHYALPVYTYETYKNFDAGWKSSGVSSRTVSVSQAYAYTWLLTAITGPDYSDANTNGFADEGDVGSWTIFNYGKFTDQYIYHSPYSYFDIDQDGSHVYSSGRKEIYYLDAIITRSHTALFQKNDDRVDGKGANDPINGGLGAYSKGVMRLENILLHRNEDITAFVINNNLTYSNVFDAVEKLKFLSHSSVSTLDKIFDSYDLSVINGNPLDNYYATVIKQVNFQSDYSLCPKTVNNSAGTGKLTLNSVGFYGTNHKKIVPNIDFTYEVSAPKSHQITGAGSTSANDFSGTIIMGSANNFAVGDIIKFVYSGTTYYAFLTKGYDANGITNNSFDCVFLGNSYPTSWGGPITAYETKNPPYTPPFSNLTPAAKDYWGYFKGDIKGYNTGIGVANPDLTKQPNSVSAKGTDVWCLRNIKTSLNGNIEISYESDSYKDVVLNKKQILNVDIIQTYYSTPGGVLTMMNTCSYGLNNVIDPMGIFKFKFYEANVSQMLADKLQIGQLVNVSTLGTVSFSANYTMDDYPGILKTEFGTDAFQITDIGPDYISGKFINPSGLSGGQYFKNPLIAHCFGQFTDPTFKLVHNSSYISFDNNNTVNYGGGVRVKKIKVSEGSTNEYYETVYEYNNPASQLSSGTTSYEPTALAGLTNPGPFYNCNSGCYPTDSLNPAVSGHTSYYKSAYAQYYNNFLKDVSSILTFSRELPPAGVIYEYVTKKEYANGIQKQGVEQYKFKIFDNTMVQRSISTASATTATGGTNSRATVLLSNYTAKVGQILEKRTFDLGGTLLSKTSFEYSSDLQKGQGALDEVFHEHRKFNVGLPSESHKAVVVKRSQYPSVLMNVETTDYLKGLTSRTENITFDFYSGKVLESQTIANGKTIMNSTKPAYSLYSGMGIKINNTQNRNMLFQEAANYSFNTKTLLSQPVQTVTTPVSGDLITLSERLPIYYSVGSTIEINGNLHAGLYESSLATIVYIASDRLSFIVNGSSFNIYPDYPNVVVKYAPISVKINSWNNSWNNRQYSSSTSQYSNTLVADNSTTVQDERVWRPYRKYAWSSAYLNTDGSFKNDGTTGSFSDFDWTAEINGNPQSSPYWLKASENTLYDQYSNLLEAKDINGNYVSTKKGYNQSFSLASTSNSNYVSSAYTSFEDIYSPVSGTNKFGGEILAASSYQTALTGGTTGLVKPHSGKYMIGLTNSTVSLFSARFNGSSTEGNIIRGKKYRASVWVHKSSDPNASLSVLITGSSPTYSIPGSVLKQGSQITSGDWYLLNLDFAVPSDYNSVATGDNIVVSCSSPSATTCYFDDFMIRPVDASIVCNVYDPLTKLKTHEFDNDGFYTRYEFDNSGRIIAAYKETVNGEKKIKSYLYNFAKP